MDSWGLRDFRNDLSRFLKLIEDYKVPGDFSEFETLKDNLDRNGLIDYNLKNLCFYVSSMAGVLPAEAQHMQVYLDNFLKFKDNYTSDIDPLFRFKLEINIHAYRNRRYEGHCYKSSWHLDQHFPSETDKYTHPSYHFQFGGRKIKSTPTGELVILETPRIPHPPMDIFLGFHFVVANYFSNQDYEFVKLLAGDYDYQKIIKRAQERLWKPYFRAFEENNSHQDFIMKNVFPLYLEN